MVDYRTPTYQFPQRKPIAAGNTPVKSFSINPPQTLYGSGSSSHVRRRTSSSGVFPNQNCGNSSPPAYVNRHSSSNGYYPAGRPISNISLRRSGSTGTTGSSSTASTSAYVATLRRQKATVWCDRSQPEDPRLMAAQKAAKLRAAMEVIGNSSSSLLTANYNHHGLGSGTGSAASSIHGGGRGGKLGRSANHVTSTVKKHWTGGSGSGSAGIGGASMVGGVPARLSASEVLGDSSDEDDSYAIGKGVHKRSGSGRSSLNSNHRRTNRASTMYSDTNNRMSTYGPGGLQHRNSNGSRRSTLSSYSPSSSIAELAEDGRGRHFALPRTKSRSPPTASPRIQEEKSGDYFTLNGTTPSSLSQSADKAELKRRGSVDETDAARTMTMSGVVRLFIANPDSD